MFWLKENSDAKEGVQLMTDAGQSILDRFRAAHSKEIMAEDTSIIGHLNRGPYKNDLERIADITIFMLAGHETTAYQLSWIIVELARHPEILRKLRVELDREFAETGAVECSPHQLSQLDYLTKVVKEGMRLWPVVAASSQRKLPVDIKYKEMVLPKGSTIQINNFIMFRSGIQKPDEFIPERWSEDGEDIKQLKELFIPFSSG